MLDSLTQSDIDALKARIKKAQEQGTEASSGSKVAQSTSDRLEIYADFAVWDTVQNRYLQPGTDYNPGDLFRR